jgi:hypothetical protein
MDSLQAILAIGVARGWHIEQMDVVSAYLARTLNEEIYMNALEGLGHPNGTTIQLIKSLYRLKQSSYIWYKKIESTLNSFSLTYIDSD